MYLNVIVSMLKVVGCTGIQVIHATIKLVDMVPECGGVLKQLPEIPLELVTNNLLSKSLTLHEV